MKKLLILVGLAGLFVVGYGKDSITCTLINEKAGLKTVNKISYSKKYVTKEHLVFQGYSSNPLFLEKEANSYREDIKSFNQLDGCDGTVKIDGNILTLTQTIDYRKININEVDELTRHSVVSLNKLIKNGKVKIADLQKSYENNNFTCK